MEIEKEIHRILIGRRYFTVNCPTLQNKLLYTIKITPKDRHISSMVYDEAVKAYINKGILSEEELLKELNENGVWTSNDEKQITRLTDNIDKLKLEKSRLKFKSTTKTIIDKQIENCYRLLQEKLVIKYTSLEMSAEYLARTNMLLSLAIGKVFLFEEDIVLWPTKEHLLDEKDYILINLVYENILSTLSVLNLRSIARSGSWRYRWNGTNDKFMGIFGTSCVELDIEQEQLVYWAQLYDSVYNSYECPSDDIIDDDELLDEWLLLQSNKNEAKVNENDLQLSDNMKKHGQVFVMAETDKDAEKIYQANPKGKRKNMHKKLENLQDKGTVTDAKYNQSKG